MNPSAILRRAEAEGVSLALTPTGTVKVKGEPAAVNRWLPILREHKPGILAALQEAANDTDDAQFRRLSVAEERSIRGWLALIGENDAAMIDAVLNQCRQDEAARTYYLERAMLSGSTPAG